MKIKYFLAVLVVALGSAPVVKAEAANQTDHIVIAALQTGQTTAAGNDFVVLHNPTADDVDVTGWKLQYRSAAATASSSWTTKRTFACSDSQADCRVVIKAGANLIVSTYAIDGVEAQLFSSGFSDVGGQVRVAKTIAGTSDIEAVDMVGYGTAVIAEGNNPAAAPPAGQALVRKSQDNLVVDTDVNADDFTVGCYQPSAANAPAVVDCEQSGDGSASGDDDGDSTGDTTKVYPKLQITELLPDPASPATDTADEFIELYNPNNEAADVTGYTLQAGADFKDTYTLKDIVVAAGGYAAVYSAQSHISLTNTGTVIQLVDPNGVVQDSTDSYGTAKTGQAWIKTQNAWQWSSMPTPGAANIITVDDTPDAATAAASTVVKKVATPKKAATTTATPKKVAAVPKVSAKSTTKAASTTGAPPSDPSVTSNNYLLFGLVGLAVLGYAGYEYRHDIGRLARKTWASLGRGKSTSTEVSLQPD